MESKYELKSTNPKDAIGIKKVPLSLVPKTALALQAMAHKDGAIKYGPANWRSEGVSARVYIDAHDRHIARWFDGREELAPDSLVHHLAHAIACLNIILDAQICGKLVDDRPTPAPIGELLDSLAEEDDNGA